MGGVELRGQEDLLAPDPAFPQSASDALLVSVGLSGVNVPIAELQGPADRGLALFAVRDLPHAEPQHRHLVAVRQRARTREWCSALFCHFRSWVGFTSHPRATPAADPQRGDQSASAGRAVDRGGPTLMRPTAVGQPPVAAQSRNPSDRYATRSESSPPAATRARWRAAPVSRPRSASSTSAASQPRSCPWLSAAPIS